MSTVLQLESKIICLPKFTKDGKVKQTKQNMKKGKKTEVYAYQIEDLKNLLNYFKDNESWVHYLLLVFSCNMARRIGDTLILKWSNIYYPDGTFRNDIVEIREDKTDKFANPHINKAVREAVILYIEKTGCNPSENDYNNPIFLQLSGTHKGTVISSNGHLLALKKAAKALDIKYNIGTHSGRKFFGMFSRLLHKYDPNSMNILRGIFNHYDERTTENYIGLTKQMVTQYYEDAGEAFTEYVIDGKEYTDIYKSPVVTLETEDLRKIIQAAYLKGIESGGCSDSVTHVQNVNEILAMVDSLAQ